MNIAYSCNDAYIPQTGVSIISVCENHRHLDDLVFYLIEKDVSDSNIRILDSICSSYNRKLVVIPFQKIAFDLKISATGRHIETIYSKIFFPRIAGINKLLYLDSDIVVNGDLKPFWNINVDNKFMAVVETSSNPCKQLLGIPQNQRCFNDGVVLVNVKYCRDNDFINRVNVAIASFDGNPPLLSEGVLNKVCGNNVVYVSPRYNMMSGLLYFCRKDVAYVSRKMEYSETDLKESAANPVIIHYLSGFYNRPWLLPCTHPFKNHFFYYLSLSPWRGLHPRYQPLTSRVRWIKRCYDLFGCKLTDTIRYILGAC